MTRKLGLLVLTLAASVHAQGTGGAKPAAAPPTAPKMTAEGKRFLEGWLGTWKSTDTTYSMGDQKMQGSFTMSCESVSSGWGTLCKGALDFAGMPPSEGTFLMAWDIVTGRAHMFEVIDTSEVHDHSGKWINDKSASLVREGKALDGKMEKDDCTATWFSARELKLACTGTQAGATVWTFSSTCKK
jgi:hypothetical protein